MSEAGARRQAGRLNPAATAQADTDAASHTGSPRLGVSNEAAPQPVDKDEMRADKNETHADSVRRPASLSARARTRMTHLLVGKSIVETLFIATLAVVFLHGALHPGFRGSVDGAGAAGVWGWVVDEAAPGARVEVQLFIDGHFAAHGWADQTRADVLAAGRAKDEFHGFSLRLPPLPPGEHEARVYAVHADQGGELYTLQQVDKPLRFNVPANAESEAAPQDWWRTTGRN